MTQPATDPKPHVRIKLSALWITLMLLYLYADFFSLYQPGEVARMLDGLLGPYPVTQTSLLIASTLMVVPAGMVALSLMLPAPICRWANLILGAVYGFVSATNLIGESWAYYWLFGLLEVAVTITIIVLAARWRPR